MTNRALWTINGILLIVTMLFVNDLQRMKEAEVLVQERQATAYPRRKPPVPLPALYALAFEELYERVSPVRGTTLPIPEINHNTRNIK